MTTRRGFLGAMLAAAAAPAIVRAASLMPIYVPKPQIITLWGDGVHDDTAALRILLLGGAVRYGSVDLRSQDGVFVLPAATFLISDTVVLSAETDSMHAHSASFVGAIPYDAVVSDRPSSKAMFHADPGARCNFTSCDFRNAELSPFRKGLMEQRVRVQFP